MRYLVFLSGPRRGSRIRLERSVVSIGRDRSNDIALEDINTSRRHAEIFLRGGELYIRDLHSTNGTFVNGAQIEEAKLSSGDQISIGDTVLLFEERQTKKITHSVAFHEGSAEEDAVQIRLDPRKSQYLNPTELAARPAAAERLVSLYRFVSELAPTLSEEGLAERILDGIFNALKVDRGFLMIDEDGQLVPAAIKLRDPNASASEFKISKRMMEKALSTGEAIFSSDTLHDSRFKDSQAFTATRVNSFICVPLKGGERILGLLYVDTVGLSMPLREDDFQLLSAMALFAGAQLMNAKLYSELLNATEYTQSILRCLRSGVLVTDNEGVVRRANDSACELLGLSESDLVGRRLADFETLAPLWRIMDETQRSGIPCERQEVVVLVAGAHVPLGVSTSLLRDHDNRVRGVVANFRSLSVIKKLSEQVRMAQHLAALGEMAAGIAHEIRNPLNSIRGFAQLLNELVKELPDARKASTASNYTDIIIGEVDRMNQLVQDLLDFSRQRELTMMETDVARCITEVLNEMRMELSGAGIQVETKVETGLPSVMANAAKLKQVLMNLIKNAIQAMTPPIAPPERLKRLVISARTLEADGRKHAVEVSVSDTGIGMDEKTQARLFEPFFTTKERGTGLGLAICRKIIEQHGGHIEADSQLGAGTTMRFTLPL